MVQIEKLVSNKKNPEHELLSPAELQAAALLDYAVIESVVATMGGDEDGFVSTFKNVFGEIMALIPEIVCIPIVINGQTTYLVEAGLTQVSVLSRMQLPGNRTYELTPTFIPGTQLEQDMSITILPTRRIVLVRRTETGQIVIDETAELDPLS